MDNVTSLQGPVELLNGELVLLIPLDAGGEQLMEYARGIGDIEGENLKIVIPSWLAEKLSLYDGCLVQVDNVGEKLNIRRLGPATPA